MNLRYGERAVFRAYHSVDEIIKDVDIRQRRLDAVFLDLVRQIKPGRLDFTFGAVSYHKFTEWFFERYRSRSGDINRVVYFYSPICSPGAIDRALKEYPENNPYHLGNRFVLYPEHCDAESIYKFLRFAIGLE
ncbi:MAG: hypothetical protein ABIF10_06145 [Candidatus Woesearchaeota archaeon]